MSVMSHVNVGIVGTGQRAASFVKNFRKYSDVTLVGLCDHNIERLNAFADVYACESALRYTTLADMLAGDRLDAVVITVPDTAHREVAEQCFEAGKHVMLEKPMALTVADCRSIIRAKEKSGRMLQLGFVLRSTPFYQTIKGIIDEGRLGQIMGISAEEYLSVGHSASYMRRWHRKSANSGSFMLAKCSHDIDMLNWLSGSRPTRVASFGSNNFFLPAKQPASHCSMCAEVQCPFRFNPERGNFVFMTDADKANPSKQHFDLCVYNDDKDIVDNQVSILEFENGIRATFSLQLFRAKGARFIAIAGSEAYLNGCMEENLVTVYDRATGRKEEYPIVVGDSGHGGGDERFAREFIDAVKTGIAPGADLASGLASTVIGVAIEKARQTGTVVPILPADYSC